MPPCKTPAWHDTVISPLPSLTTMPPCTTPGGHYTMLACWWHSAMIQCCHAGTLPYWQTGMHWLQKNQLPCYHAALHNTMLLCHPEKFAEQTGASGNIWWLERFVWISFQLCLAYIHTSRGGCWMDFCFMLSLPHFTVYMAFFFEVIIKYERKKIDYWIYI